MFGILSPHTVSGASGDCAATSDMYSGVFAIVCLEEDVVEMGAKAVVDETPTPMARATADILNLTMISVLLYYLSLGY